MKLAEITFAYKEKPKENDLMANVVLTADNERYNRQLVNALNGYNESDGEDTESLDNLLEAFTAYSMTDEDIMYYETDIKDINDLEAIKKSIGESMDLIVSNIYILEEAL